MAIKREWDFKVPYRNIRTVTQEMKEAALRVLDSGLYHAAWECLEFEKDFMEILTLQVARPKPAGRRSRV